MSNEKNAQIKATLLATKERRKTQKCFVFSTKLNYRKLNKLQKEQLKMLFVLFIWVYTDIIYHMEFLDSKLGISHNAWSRDIPK